MSSRTARLAASASFSHAAPAVSARRAAIAAATEAPTAGTEGSRPDELPLHLISENPDNPREELGDLTDISQTLGEVGLVTAITVATVDAYLKERPGRASDLAPGAEYVVVDGHRRLAAAREAGLETIKYIVNDGFAASDEKLLEAAYVANAHRENMSELEEAAALEKLVVFYGSQRKASQRLGITQAFISQRLSLLRLDVSLQAELAAGARKVEHVRGLAALPAEEQRAKADERAAEAAQKAEKRRAVPAPAAVKESEGDNGVITQPDPADVSASEGGGDNAVITQGGVPDPRTGQETETAVQAAKPPQVKMPWGDGVACAEIAISKMTRQERQRMLVRLQEQEEQERSAGV